MATAAAATPAKALPSLPEAVLHTLFGSTWFGGDDLFVPASHARPAHAAKVHAPTQVRSPLPHQLGYDDGEDEAHVHVRLHNMPSGARVSSSASGATLHIDTGKGAKTHAGSTPSGTGSPGDPAFEIATHHFTGGMAGTSVHPSDPHGAGANIAHRVAQKSAPQAASGSANPWSLDSLLHLPGKLAVSAAAWEGRMADDAVEGVEEKLGLAKPQKPGTARKPGTFEQFNRAYTAAIVGGVEDMVGGLWKMEVYANTHPIEFYAGIGKHVVDAAKWALNTDVKILKAGYTAGVESTTAKGRRQLWHDGAQAWDSSVKTALGLYHQTANTINAARKSGTLATLVGDVAGKIVVNVAPALVGAPEISAARIGGSLALKEGVEIGAKTVLKDAATEAAPVVARAPELEADGSSVLDKLASVKTEEPPETISVWRRMSDTEAERSLDQKLLQPPIKGTNSSKYLSESLDKAIDFKNKGYLGTSESILEFTLDKAGYDELMSTAVEQDGSRGIDAVKKNYEGLEGTTHRNIGVPRTRLGQFNRIVRDIKKVPLE